MFGSPLLYVIIFSLLFWCASPSKREEQQNKREKSNAKPPTNTNITSVICVLMKFEETYVDEWITYHKLLGFNHIHIMENGDNMTDKMKLLPDIYGNLVSVEHYPGIEIQAKSYQSCAKRYNQTGHWIAFIDSDEFIMLRKHHSINDFIQEIALIADSVSIHRVIFGSNHLKYYQNLPVLMRFTRRGTSIDNMMKTIAHAPSIKEARVHASVMHREQRRVDANGNRVGDLSAGTHRNKKENVAVIYHYRMKSEEEYLRRKERGDAVFYEAGQQLATNRTLALELFHSLDQHANEVVDERAWDFFRARSKGIL